MKRSGAAHPQVIDLGRTAYEPAYRRQCDCVEEVLSARDAGVPVPGFILLVEHDPTITVSRRPGAADHLLVSRETLARQGISIAETDRGGDITYHGPGQLVVYPVLDLNWYGLRVHDYVRLLEDAVIRLCAQLGLPAQRDACATGVWVGSAWNQEQQCGFGTAKICAMGVRIRKWVSMHGLALNVDPDLAHFDNIVPCGLAGRRVTSLRRELAEKCPTLDDVKPRLTACLQEALSEQRVRAQLRQVQESPAV